MTKNLTAVLLAVIILLSMTTVAFATVTPTITVSSATAFPGETVTLDVVVSDNPGINTFSLGFDYDTTRLSLENVTVSSSLGGQFAYSKKAVWLNSADTTYNGEILTLEFKVFESAPSGEAEVSLTYSPGDISNYDEEDVNFELVSGKIIVAETEKQENQAKLSVTTATAQAGETVSLKVIMTNNPGINTFSLGFGYDTTRLSLENVTVSSSLGGQFAYSKKAVWLNSADTTYNGEILTLEFKVLESAPSGEAEVSLTYSPGDISNYDEEDVNFELISGKIIVGEIEEQENKAKLSVTTATAQAGETVSLKVIMTNNPGINTFSLGFDYDTTRLSLENVTASSSLGGQFAYSKKAVWLNSADTTYNGEILTLEFKVLESAPSGEAEVSLTYSLGDISNYDEEDVNFNLVSGKVIVGSDLSGKNKVSGKIISFFLDTDNVTIILTPVGSEGSVYSVSVSGNNAEYCFDNIKNGEYTMGVLKDNHIERTYNIVVSDNSISQDVKIHLAGDITGDGKVNTIDVARANSHAKSVEELTDYTFTCADVNGDGKVNTIDVARMNSHAKGVTTLW